MNETMNRLMSHRSIRKFTEKPVNRETLEDILRAAQMASSSSNMQAYSVINITDPQKRRQLAHIASDQSYVTESPVFLVWCADLQRLAASCGFDAGSGYVGTTENLVAALVDAALAAQNAVVAAESLGLGAVYIGAIRNHIHAVAELLELPELVMPVFGMCLGYPDQEPILRPRLPLAAVLHENRYDADKITDLVGEYDLTTERYMVERSGGKSKANWTDSMKKKLSAPIRMDIARFIGSRGFWRNEEKDMNPGERQ
ncbi:oxygen-insensitive NADPH nitroreductase [Gorillibacterium massiliense]|uniref:oxygen-insensitive NADPH nitroreductase n=1 Tax=Gorillibacterium massiliense TaxID=1280390 RepID=UPI0004B361F1|nr:oxygen-insensitive NADPH nitroreductase [Gorillibacterium massiliense]